MARALIKHWNGLSYNGQWSQTFEVYITDQGSNWLTQIAISLADNDSQAQIKAKMADSIRTFATTELGVTVENNQVIYPDGSRG